MDSLDINNAADVQHFCKTANKKNAEAQYNFGTLFRLGRYTDQNDRKALIWLKRAADQGHVEAQKDLGDLHYHGNGTPKDRAAAARWYSLAAAQGDVIGQVHLAIMYHYGQGVATDQMEAVKWYMCAAMQGDAKAWTQLNLLAVTSTQKDISTIEAQYNLGTLYRLNPDSALNEDQTQNKIIWFKRAATQGHVGAQNALGEIYSNGEGVATDQLEALHWHQLAAEQGDATGQFQLANIYQFGAGVKKHHSQNKVMAATWYARAAAQGNAEAQTQLDLLMAQDDYNDAEAQYNLGRLYKYGHGITQDFSMAVTCYRKAATQGHAEAQQDLGNMYYHGDGVAEDKAEALRWCDTSPAVTL